MRPSKLEIIYRINAVVAWMIAVGFAAGLVYAFSVARAPGPTDANRLEMICSIVVARDNQAKGRDPDRLVDLGDDGKASPEWADLRDLACGY